MFDVVKYPIGTNYKGVDSPGCHLVQNMTKSQRVMVNYPCYHWARYTP
jgi:hypothetical protein